MRSADHCFVCGDRLDTKRGSRGDRCLTCNLYFRRNGVDRSFDLIRRLAERDLERQLRGRRR